MRRIWFSLLILGLIYGCGDDKAVNEQSRQTLPSASGIAPTLSDPGTTGELSPAAVPVADFTVSPGLSGTNNTVFTFDASSTQGTVTKYKWRFGDDTSAKGPLVTHKYQYGGTYTVKLVAVSDIDEKDKAKQTLTITGPPNPNDDGGGGGGGGGAVVGTCTLNDYRTNVFTVISVSGTVATIDKNFRGCNACGEVRRQATGIQEFVGDVIDITGNKITFDYGNLPLGTRPKPGERMYLVWKSINFRPHCTN